MAIQDMGQTFDSKWAGVAGYEDAYRRLAEQQSALGSSARGDIVRRLDTVGSQFNSMFESLVGRAPNTEELGRFYTETGGDIVYNSPLGRSEADSVNVRNQVGMYVNDTFQKTAQQVAEEQLRGQQTEADSLAELFRGQGRSAISQTENQLLDFQTRLFERLRPQMMTSLQAQGLLNTGALNESLAGAAKDLSDASQTTLMDMNFQNEQQANAIKFGGASAPYEFSKAAIMGRPDNMRQTGMDALNRAFTTYSQNLDFQQKSALMRQQINASKPSFLNTLGQSFATQLGKSGGEWFSPNAGGKDGSSGAAAMALLSSRDSKYDITKLTEKQEDELYDKLMAMPLSVWKYKGTDAPHIGVITDEAIPEVVMPDGKHLSAVDYLGVLTLSLKVQDRRMKQQAGK